MNKQDLQQLDRIIEWIEKATNAELISRTLSVAGGDDYDACFTELGKAPLRLMPNSSEEFGKLMKIQHGRLLI